MDVVINSDCGEIPEQSHPLISEKNAILNFLQALGYDSCNPPLAQVLERTLHLEGSWYILSPIYWQATHNDAMISAANNTLQLNEERARYAFQRYATYLAEDCITIHYYKADTWLIQCTNKPKIQAQPVHHLINKSLMPVLQQLDDSLYWQTFFTESQMYFASLPDISQINGVWVWGGAPLLSKKSVAVCADEEWLSTAQICSDNVSLYQPTLSLKQYSIVLISHLDVLSQSHQNELKKSSHRWYWVNCAYRTSPLNCLTRLWRTLTHAD